MGAMRISASQTTRRLRLRPRPGMTLVEMMVVVVLLAIVGGAVMSTLAKQQAFYRSTSDVMDLRSQMRQAAAVLSNDLRGVASGAGDINSMSENSIDFYYNIGSSVVCDVNLGNGTATLPPLTLASGNTLSQWTTRPARNDMVYIYSDPDTASTSDDTWQSFAVDTLIAQNALCNMAYTQAADASSPSYQVKVSTSGPSMATGLRRGSTVRFMRRVVYQIYQSSADNRWYLGFCTPTCTTTNPAQPIAGPFNAFSSGSASSGLAFTYYDANGNVTATRSEVARISFVFRAQSRARINIPGMGKGFYTDSLRTEVALRNRT
jgi:prepilin-type N-terminal cleavage/methylation domain-containing protein